MILYSSDFQGHCQNKNARTYSASWGADSA